MRTSHKSWQPDQVWEDWFYLKGFKLELGLAHVAGEEVELTYIDNPDDYVLVMMMVG